MKDILKKTSGVLIVDVLFFAALALPRSRENLTAMVMFGCCLAMMTVLNWIEAVKSTKYSEEEQEESVDMKIGYYIGILFGIAGGVFVILG